MKSFDELMAEQSDGDPSNTSIGLIFREEDSSIAVLDVIAKCFGKIQDEDNSYNSMADAECEIAVIQRPPGKEGITQIRPLFRVKTPEAACFYVKAHYEDPNFMQIVSNGAHLLGAYKAMESMPPEVKKTVEKMVKQIQAQVCFAEKLGIAPDFDASCN